MTFVANITNAAAQAVGITKQEVGLAGFKAYATVTSDMSLESEAPESYLENGSVASDHIVLKPVTIRIEGSVADVHQDFAVANEAYLRARAEIGNVSKYLPDRTTAQLDKVDALFADVSNTVRAIDAAVQDGTQLVGNFMPKALSNRERFVETMRYLHYSKELLSISVAFTVMDNMRITSCVFREDNQTEEIRFSITAKEIRYAQTEFTDITEFFSNPSPGAGGKTESIASKGRQGGKDVTDTSIWSAITGITGQ